MVIRSVVLLLLIAGGARLIYEFLKPLVPLLMVVLALVVVYRILLRWWRL